MRVRPTTARLTGLRDRLDDMLIVRGVNIYPSQVEHLLLSDGGVAPHYRLAVERPGPLDELTVECEPADGAADPTLLQARLEHLLRDNLGLRITVTVARPGQIPRSEGKAVRVVDRRPGQQPGAPIDDPVSLGNTGWHPLASPASGGDVSATFITTFSPQGPGPRVAVKDLIDMAGIPTTAGSRVVAESAAPAEADAACLAGLRAAGAQIVGRANLDELALGVTGINPWFGTPSTRSIPHGRPEGPPADRRSRWAPAKPPWPTAPIPAGRSGFPPPAAASAGSRRPGTASR